ncbi:CAAX prenyl protease-like protein [Christiangramia gaetbulicola]|uniref:CAAX prenyl protease-like protein n=1 Tax=Christiangramia gaetbulicola TaxID=703340 RepID=A0A2T6AGP5_9FLAO|nr:CPBP family intramembrane glutamic endopeptidase [Christiangramia gaetbulicola]PTX42981.1 CAAX prenyl protease-like protein [Christiangramia gaetbulicola]
METVDIILLSYGGYFGLSYLSYQLKVVKIGDAIIRDLGFKIINLRHLLGIVLFSLPVILYFDKVAFLLKENPFQQSWSMLGILALAIIAIKISTAEARRKKLGFRDPKFSINKGLIYIVIRLIFLFCYELFFRGVLFIFCLELIGLIPSILINIFLYALIHITDSKKEIVGSIPFGILLCFFTYYTGSIWPAFLIHAALSLGFETILINRSLTKIQKS